VTLRHRTQGEALLDETLIMSLDSAPQDPRPFGAPFQRTPVEFDPATARLRIGPHERRVDPAKPGSVYAGYLSLLYAVRGSKPGTQLPLRAADLEALLLIVGDDPDTIEQRLVGLMGCSARRPPCWGRCCCATAAASRPSGSPPG
jgi:hypothetical protein